MDDFELLEPDNLKRLRAAADKFRTLKGKELSPDLVECLRILSSSAKIFLNAIELDSDLYYPNLRSQY